MAKSQMIKRVHQKNNRKQSFLLGPKTVGGQFEPEDIASRSKWHPPSPPQKKSPS